MATAKSAARATTIDDTGFGRAVDRVRDSVKTLAASATGNASDGVASLVDQGADGVKAVAGKVPEVSYWIDERIEGTRDRVRSEPIKMLAIAAGVGAVLGALLLRR